MSKELNDKNKAVIDRLFVNGFDRAEAWGSEYPNTQPKYIATSIYQMLSKDSAKKYYEVKHDEFKAAIKVDKHTMIDNLIRQIELFDNMLILASKDELTDLEYAKLERLKDLVKGSDIMKAKDMICKLVDAYAPVKIEVKEVTYNVGFDMSEDDDITDAKIIE